MLSLDFIFLNKMNRDSSRAEHQQTDHVSFGVPELDQNVINSGHQRDKLEFLSAGYEFNENAAASETLNMGGVRGKLDIQLISTLLFEFKCTFYTR